MLKLQSKKRDLSEKLSKVREEGFVPAVFYGIGKETTSISVLLKDFIKVWKEAGESTTVTLDLDGKSIETLIHEVQVDPIKGNPIHVDFWAIDINKPVTVSVPLEYVGISEAVKSQGGILVKVMHEIEIEALPKNLPHNITIDISSLKNIDDTIAVKDLALPNGVTAITHAEEIVASVTAQKEEVEESAPVDLSKIEVEKKGKKEEEAEA